jgi:hypothetical protein
VRIRIQPWWYAALLTAGCAALMFGVYWLRFRSPASPSELTSLLPAKDATVVYIDVDGLRRTGFLNLIAGSKAAEELEYQQFVDQTQFDYKQDLDAVAAAFRKGDSFFALRGRFHWKELMAYAAQQGGSCHNGFCMFAGSTPNRHISFYPIRGNVMGLAISDSADEAAWLIRKGNASGWTPPQQPIWMMVPAARLNDATSIPEGIRPFAAALKGTQEIVLSIGPQDYRFTLKFQATCDTVASASSLLVDLENASSTVRAELAKDRAKAKPGDLADVLASGAFRREDRRVYGEWPVARSTLDALFGGAY